MEKLKKYFEFNGTISGLNYFLRQLLSSLVALIGGFILGYGFGAQSVGLMALGMVILSPAIWFSFTTIYKRCNAIFPERATEYALSIVTLQLLGQFGEGTAWGGLITLVLVGIGLYLIFKNSNIVEHNG